MNENIEVSIICNTYNHENYIRDALESFLMQKTNFKFEVLIHDDASTDKTPEIIREYEEKYPDIVKPVYQKENQYSQGIRYASLYQYPRVKGKYIAFCEGDDYWTDPQKLQKQYDILEEKPKIVMCVHKVQVVDAEKKCLEGQVYPGAKLGLNFDQELTQNRLSDLFVKNKAYAFQTSSYFLRKELIYKEERILLAEKMNGDEALLRVALLFGEYYYFNEVMSHYRRMTGTSLTDKISRFSVMEKIKFQFNFLDGMILFDELSKRKYHKQTVYRVYAELLKLLLQYTENKREIMQYKKGLKRRLKFSPFVSLKLDIAYTLYCLCPTLLRRKRK